jgi:hypothetical protein
MTLPKSNVEFRMRRVLLAVALTPVCLGLLANASNAREITGSTKSTNEKLAVMAVATDGSKYTANVTVVRQKQKAGKTVYFGTYDLDVPEGKKVMVQFNRVNADGSLTPLTTTRFYTSAAHSKQTWMFNVTAPLAGGGEAISFGQTKVGHTNAPPEVNPLLQVDEDGDGNDDYDDADDDNDGVDDEQDEDEDGDGVDDQDEDFDEDGDGVSDDQDDDDQGEDGDGDNDGQ